MVDWNNFTAFGDTAILDKSIFVQSSAHHDGDASQNAIANTNDDVIVFYDWLNRLRNFGDLVANPNYCGIPQERHQDVARLLLNFFPLPVAPLVQTPVRLRYRDPNPGTNRFDADPCEVHFGANDVAINITDGPTALAYIFTVATPTSNPPTYETYFLPLHALLARCLYLAYIGRGVAEKLALINVPWMSCSMYGRDMNPLPYMFGSTYTTGDKTIPWVAAVEEGKQRMMNAWRRDAVLNIGLATMNPEGVLPVLEPCLRRAVAEVFYKCFSGKDIGIPGRNLDIQNRVIPEAVATPIHDMLNAAFVTAYNIQVTGGAALIAPMDPGLYLDPKKQNLIPGLRAQLQALCLVLVDLRWTAGYQRDDPAVGDALKDLFTFVLTPHFFPKDAQGDANASVAEIALAPPGITAAVTAAVAPVLAAHSNNALTTLDFVHGLVVSRDDSLQGAGPTAGYFGRCSETYPAVCMLPHFYPDRTEQNIRGFAIQNRVLGKTSHPLAANFTSDALNGLDRKIYRLPCDDCKVLLPVFNIPIGQDLYYGDLYQINPEGAPNVQ